MKTFRFESQAVNQDEKLNQICDFMSLLTEGKSKDLKNFVEKNAIRLEEVEEKMYFEV